MTPQKRPTIDPQEGVNLFKKTEPEAPAQPVRRVKRRRGRPKTSDKTNPVGVTLEEEELERLNEMAAELGISRSVLLSYAVRDFMRRWEAGERPKTRKRTIEELDM